jgi:hypothetical protein
MTKPARTISPGDRDVIHSLHEAVRNSSVQAQLADMRSELRGILRGLEMRVATLERENYALRNEISAIKTGVRTTGERRCAEAERVAGCGRGGDA